MLHQHPRETQRASHIGTQQQIGAPPNLAAIHAPHHRPSSCTSTYQIAKPQLSLSSKKRKERQPNIFASPEPRKPPCLNLQRNGGLPRFVVLTTCLEGGS